MPTAEFEFLEGESGGQFVLVGGPLGQLRQLLAKGDVDAAVRLYEETGAVSRAELLAEALTASFDTKKAIALLFRKARDFSAAARTFRIVKLDGEAAASFEQAGEYAEAAACWVGVGEVLKAAAAWERAGKTDAAVTLYRQAGAAERAAECLARGQRFLEAAQEFGRLGNAHAEFEALKAGLTATPNDLDVVSRLAEVTMQHGRTEQATQLLCDTARRVPESTRHPRFLTLLATGLEAVGNAASAEKVRARLKELPAAAVVPASAPAAVKSPAAPRAAEPGTDAYGFLKALPMFAALSFDDMKALYRVCALQTYQTGQHLIEPGQPGRGLFLLVDGQVEVFAGADPSSRLLNTLGVGAYVGEISLVQDGPTSARVTARSPVKVLFISRDAFHHYMFSNPLAALRIYQLFTHNLAERVRVLSAAK